MHAQRARHVQGLWGCNAAKVMDAAMACLDATSLLLGELGSIDAGAVRARLNEWDTPVVANELVEIFERLQLVEPSFQSRADTKTKALAAGIFDDLFLRLPHIGAQFMRDCRSPRSSRASSISASRSSPTGIKAQSGEDAAAEAAWGRCSIRCCAWVASRRAFVQRNGRRFVRPRVAARHPHARSCLSQAETCAS